MKLNERERWLIAIVALLAVTAAALPFVPQDEGFHQFADTRAWLGLPNAQNVLSNLPFAIAGIWGLILLVANRLTTANPAVRAFAGLFFTGFIVTAVCSSLYHASPASGHLTFDRMGMVLDFAGTFGMLAADKAGARAGWILGTLALVAGPASVLWWRLSGDLGPYTVVQFGGMFLLLLAVLFWREPGGPKWGWVLGLYALAKVTEVYDFEIYAATGHLVGGHAVKHLLAAGTALAVILPMLDDKAVGQPRGRWRAAV